MEEERDVVLLSFSLEFLYSDEGQYNNEDIEDMQGEMPGPNELAEIVAAFVESRFDVQVTNNWTGDIGASKGKL